MWTKHVRWPSWNGFLGSNPLDTKGLSIPQGDPLGPMLAALWLSSGQRYVEDISPDPYGCTVIYMDDRTFSTSNVSQLKARRDAWILWSSKVGLCENIGKSQVTARSTKQKNLLPDFFTSDLIVSDILFLGLLVVALEGKIRQKKKSDWKLLMQLSVSWLVWNSVLRSFHLMPESLDLVNALMAGSLGCLLGLIAKNFGTWPNMPRMLTIWLILGLGLLCLVD